MRKFLVLLAILASSTAIFAQYSRPYRVAYNPDKKSYLVTNRGDGKILELDSNYKLKTVVTGLVDPKDLVVGTVGGNKGLLLIDNNKIVVYDATGYNKIITYNISTLSWSEIEDIEMDPRDPTYFYLSDVGAGRIIKGKVGPPPFYTPSYSVLVSSGLNRPRGLMFNSKDELLVVTDDSNAKVIKIDTLSGKLTTVFTPGVDSLNSIAQDKEGNYFITNWDDSYLYRCDKNFKNLKKLTSYNKPAGMAINVKDDLLILLCHYCNKMEFHKLHYTEPSPGAGTCVGDSFNVEVSITAEGVGSYNASNKFQVELSDESGGFKKPTILGGVNSAVKPKSIKCYLPKGSYGSNHKIRIKSTSPVFYSTAQDITIFDTPDLSAVVGKWTLCKGSTVALGKKGESDESYQWKNANSLSDSTIANPSFTANDTGSYAWTLKATNTTYQCKDEIEVFVDVNPDIQLADLKRKVALCLGDSIDIGVTNSPYSFEWSPTMGLNRTDLQNPLFNGSTDQTYQVKVEDKSTGCKGQDSVSVQVNKLPIVTVASQWNTLCAREKIKLQADGDASYTYRWAPIEGLSDTLNASTEFSRNIPGKYIYVITVQDTNSCVVQTSMEVQNNALPQGRLIGISGTTHKFGNNKVSFEGSIDGSAFCVLHLITSDGNSQRVDTFYSLPVVNFQMSQAFADTLYTDGYLEFVSDSGCLNYSDTMSLFWANVKKVFVSEIRVYPNPTYQSLHIETGSLFLKSISVTNVNGIVVTELLNLNGKTSILVDVNSYKAGVYIIYVTDEFGLTYQKKFVKLD
jgi:hypothetical protein